MDDLIKIIKVGRDRYKDDHVKSKEARDQVSDLWGYLKELQDTSKELLQKSMNAVETTLRSNPDELDMDEFRKAVESIESAINTMDTQMNLISQTTAEIVKND